MELWKGTIRTLRHGQKMCATKTYVPVTPGNLGFPVCTTKVSEEVLRNNLEMLKLFIVLSSRESNHNSGVIRTVREDVQHCGSCAICTYEIESGATLFGSGTEGRGRGCKNSADLHQRRRLWCVEAKGREEAGSDSVKLFLWRVKAERNMRG